MDGKTEKTSSFCPNAIYPLFSTAVLAKKKVIFPVENLKPI